MNIEEKQDSTQNSSNELSPKERAILEQQIYMSNLAGYYKRLEYMIELAKIKDKLPSNIQENVFKFLEEFVGINETNEHTENQV